MASLRDSAILRGITIGRPIFVIARIDRVKGDSANFVIAKRFEKMLWQSTKLKSLDSAESLESFCRFYKIPLRFYKKYLRDFFTILRF